MWFLQRYPSSTADLSFDFRGRNDQNQLSHATATPVKPRRLPGLLGEKHPQAAPADAFQTPGVKRYVQVLPVESSGRDLVVGPRTGLVEPFDGIAELWVESEEALLRDWSTEKAKDYVKIFFEDEKNFIDWTRSTILVSNENVVIE